MAVFEEKRAEKMVQDSALSRIPKQQRFTTKPRVEALRFVAIETTLGLFLVLVPFGIHGTGSGGEAFWGAGGSSEAKVEEAFAAGPGIRTRRHIHAWWQSEMHFALPRGFYPRSNCVICSTGRNGANVIYV